MASIKFSVADQYGDADRLFGSLGKTGAGDDITQEVRAVSWPLLWSFLLRAQDTAERFDVSEMGSTWLSSFAHMGALHDLSQEVVAGLGGEGAFVPAAWASSSVEGDERRFGVPFQVDTRVLYFWGDILYDAGIDAGDAFDTPAHMERTIAGLRNAGKPTWATPTFAVTNVVHHIASWIWAGGGDFLSPEGTQTAFCRDDALGGIVAYFSLQRYMLDKYDSLDAVWDAFTTRRAAVTMGGPELYHRLRQILDAEHLARLGVALPPGPPFVGGTSLVVWNGGDASRREAAFDWMKRLTRADAQTAISGASGLLPVLRDQLGKPPYATDPRYAVFGQAIQDGRPLPRVPIWGPLEAELVQVFGKIWSDLKEDPRYGPEKAVVINLPPMAERFDDKLYRHSLSPS